MKTKRKTTPRDDEEPSPTRHLVNYERNYYKERYLQVKLDQAESESLKHRDSAQRLSDALNALKSRCDLGLDQSPDHDGIENCKAIANAREALAQWEGGKQ